MEIDIDEAEAILRVEKGSKVSKMSSKEVKRDILLNLTPPGKNPEYTPERYVFSKYIYLVNHGYHILKSKVTISFLFL